MPKNPKPGWLYKYSEELKQEIAIHKETGWIYCQDGTKYSPQEVAMIKDTGMKLPKSIHDLKRAFDGEIVKTEKAKDKPKPKKEEPEDKYAGLPEIW